MSNINERLAAMTPKEREKWERDWKLREVAQSFGWTGNSVSPSEAKAIRDADRKASAEALRRDLRLIRRAFTMPEMSEREYAAAVAAHKAKQAQDT